MSDRDAILAELKGKRFPVLDKGSITLIDVMGSDEDICQAARQSYGNGTRSVSDDRTLIRYLMRKSHTSPFEMAVLKFHFRMPQMVWWQMVRHRTASANVESGRYSEMSEDMLETAPDAWRSQSTTNKQGSVGTIPEEWTEDLFIAAGYPECHRKECLALYPTPGDYLSRQEETLQATARSVYRERLRMGVAREQARADLPMSVYIHLTWKIDLHNLFHFLRLRMDGHAQLEIRSYAEVIGREVVAPLFPIAYEAFSDYVLGSVTLSRLDAEAIRRIQAGEAREEALSAVFSNNRELSECREKLGQLGF